MKGFLTGCQALRIAFEDRETMHFILTSFAPADERPHIFSSRWRSGDDPNAVWNIVIVERKSAVLAKTQDLCNAALLQVDAAAGVVIGRRFFKGVYRGELQRAVKQDLEILLGGCTDPRM
jgi:hypothetical protein